MYLNGYVRFICRSAACERSLRAARSRSSTGPGASGSIIVTARAWWDFLSYCPGYPPLLVRVTPNAYTEQLRKHLDRFLVELAAARAALDVRLAA
jgi:hypothetical protein